MRHPRYFANAVLWAAAILAAAIAHARAFFSTVLLPALAAGALLATWPKCRRTTR